MILIVMAPLDSGHPGPRDGRVFGWMAGPVLGLDPGIKPGHDCVYLFYSAAVGRGTKSGVSVEV
jgi:hypothetical protein